MVSKSRFSWHRFVLVLVLAVFSQVARAESFAIDMLGAQLTTLGMDYQAENHHLSGSWPGQQSWNGTLCDGNYQYETTFGGSIDPDTTFEFNWDGSMIVHAKLSSVQVGVDGSYKSQYTVCRQVSGWLGVGIDWVNIDARVTFLPQVKVELVGSDFGPMRLGRWVPAWFARETRAIVQRSFLSVWQRHFAGWVNEYLSRKPAQN